jgi:hypothetical protein
MARYEVHVLVPADGQRYVGEWQRVSTHRAEADALREIEDRRDAQRRVRGWSQSYRVVTFATLEVREGE